MNILITLQGVDGPIWSPDSNNILYSAVNDKKPSIDLELDGTTDLVKYDLNLMREEILLEANTDFLYSPVSWDENGISYIKTYLDGNGTEEEYIYGKSDTGIGDYEIVGQAYSLDENKLL